MLLEAGEGYESHSRKFRRCNASRGVLVDINKIPETSEIVDITMVDHQGLEPWAR